MTASNKLEPYRGREVIGTVVKLTGAGDGLSEPMALEPVIYEEGDVVDVVIRCHVDKHTYKRVMAGRPKVDTGTLELIQSWEAEAMVVVPSALAEEYFQEQADRLRKVREAQEGTYRLQLGNELQAEHLESGHDTFVEGCPVCEDEAGPLDDDDLPEVDDLHGDAPEAEVEDHNEIEVDALGPPDAIDTRTIGGDDSDPRDLSGAELTDEDRAFMEAQAQ